MARPRQGILGLLLALALAVVLVAAQGKPESAVSSFKNLPARLFFFDDTDTAIYHDSMEGNLYVSTNEGKTWKLAPGIPEGKVMMVFEHPTDNRYAFALTDGKTHYRTEDRGHTWRSFDVPLSPAMTARPLSFHSDPKKYDYILYQGTSCSRRGMSASCHDETYYTTKAFGDDVKPLLKDVERCQFAHSSKEFKHEAHEDLIYCVGFDSSSSSGSHSLASSKLFSSTDFFQKDNKIEDLGIGKNARGVIAFAIVSKFAVVALKDMTKSTGDMLLYVTVDTKTWAQAHFPHASSAQLRENAYTMLESTTHSLAVDVVLQDKSPIGTLFISNGNGTYFVESLKDTNRNELGYVDFERIYGVEGIGLANVVANAAAVEGRGAAKSIRTVATFDDGSSWVPLRPPIEDVEGKTIHCDPKDSEECALHLHSVTSPHNFGRIFSSPAPGFVMGVGSIGKRLLPYTECDTFLSTDAGVTWRMVARGAHKYEFGDLGSILIAVDDEDTTSEIKYSLDLGKTWKTYDFGVRLRARGLITLPDSTSQKFLLLGQVARPDQTKEVGRVVIVALDFQKTRGKKCRDDDFEKWFARPHDSECLLGHKQWYKRRKPDADCYVGDKYNDPVVHDEPCKCTDADYECDYNFVREGDKCVLQGHEKIPPNVCPPGKPDQEYEGSSGFRKIAGDTCEGGIKKDEPVKRKCSQAAPPEGDIASHVHPFDSPIVQHAFFKDSKTILVRLKDNSVWQSSNEGQTWNEPVPKGEFWGFYHHRFSSDRAYLITASNVFWYTTDTGRSWNKARAPTPPNSFGAQVLRFHPTSDNLIWVGNKDCEHVQSDCHAEAHYTRDNGREWTPIETYVRNCAFARDTLLDADPTEIMCESYKTKKGQQRILAQASQPELVVGANYYDSRRQKKLFGGVIGFAKFSEFLVVAETHPEKRGLNLQVSLDGEHFAPGQFPPMMHPDTHEYTVLESNTKALFMFMTISERPMPFWGTILKSNSNGTYFGISLDLVNRDARGYVDFEKLIGLDGIALVNVVSNPDEAMHSGKKELQSRITHNDGSTWTTLPAPLKDSLGKEYSCKQAKCSLHIHGYTERPDPRATYSTPSVPGLLMAVGNVGQSLAPYIDSDTFLSRDAGFTWEEVHKDAHLWEFGDSGSIIVMANDEEPVDYVLYSTDEGLSWKEYTFSPKGDKIRIRSIVTVPSDTSRKFILLGEYPKTRGSVAVQIDFTSLTFRQCKVSVEDPGHDDFELWSPSEVRAETCLFGRQTKYHRRMRTADCVVGDQAKPEDIIVNNCACTKADFECEFNYMKDHDDNCVLVPGTTPLPDDDSCSNGEEYWYERTAYRRVSYSTCEDGYRPDRGTQHVCPGFRSKGSWFWFWMLLLPFAFTAVVAYYYWKRSGLARGTIRLPGDTRRSPFASQDSGMMATLASVPWFIIGVGGIAYEWVASRLQGFGAQRGYRHVPIDEDAQILRFEDEE